MTDSSWDITGKLIQFNEKNENKKHTKKNINDGNSNTNSWAGFQHIGKSSPLSRQWSPAVGGWAKGASEGEENITGEQGSSEGSECVSSLGGWGIGVELGTDEVKLEYTVSGFGVHFTVWGWLLYESVWPTLSLKDIIYAVVQISLQTHIEIKLPLQMY